MQAGRAVRNALIGILILTFGILALAAFALRMGMLNGMLRSEITRILRDRYRARIEMGALKLDVLPLAVSLKNVVVREEDSPPAEPPVFRATELLVGVRFLPLLHGKVELSQLVLEQPLVRLRVGAKGRNNFAFSSTRGPSPNPSGPGTVFDLEIGNCEIHSGEFYYNDSELPIDAEAHDVKFAAHYDLLAGKFQGSLSYDRGRIVETHLAPIVHAAQVEFTATPSVLTIHSLRVTSGASDGVFDATLSNYSDPVIDSTYHVSLRTADLAAILKQNALPMGTVALQGTLHYHGLSQQSFLAALNVQGQLRSDGLSLSTAQTGANRGIKFNDVSGTYELKDRSLHVQRLSADVLDGRMQATADIDHIDAAEPTVRLTSFLKGASLAVASATFAPSNVREIPLAGTTDLEAQAGWTGPFSSWSKALTAHARLSLSSPARQTGGQQIPVSGLILVDYDAPHDRISFGQSHLETTATKVSITGTLGARAREKSEVMIEATTSDLREANSLVALVQRATNPDASTFSIPGLSGSATVTATATGTLNAPRIQGRVTAQNLSVGATHWRALRADLSASPSSVSIRDASLTGDSHEQIALSGEVGLQDWTLAVNSPISVQGMAEGMTLTEVARIAHLNYPITASISGNVSLTGTRGEPEGKATITLANGSAWGQPFRQLVFHSEFHQGAIHSNANLETPAGAVSADATYTLASQTYSLQLHSGGLQLAKIGALQGRDMQGTVELSGMGDGTLSDPGLQANLAVPQLETQGQKISNIAAQINVAHQHANISLNSVVDQGSVQATADVGLTGGHYTTASLEIRALPVAALLANFMPAQMPQIGGQTEIHATLQGPLAAPEQIQARLQIPSLNVTYGAAQLALSHPLEADYQNGVLTLMKSQIQGTDTNLTFGGTIPIKNPAAYSLSADGTVDLDILHQFVSSIDSKGELDVHITSQGGADQPAMQGKVQVKNAVFSSQTLPVSVEGLNGEIALSGNRAVINNLSGTVGGGKVSATGSFDGGRAAHFAVAVNAQSVRIRYPEGLRSVVSAQINATGSPDSSALTGRVTVDSLGFTQAFDLSKFAAALSETSGGGSSSGFEQKMKLNVAVLSAQDLNLANSQVSLGGSANLNLVGTLADPVVLGRVALTNGDVFFLNKRFAVQSGTIEFANPARTQPVLNLYVTTTIEQYDVTLKLVGPLNRLRTSYTSQPSLSQADIIHLLAFGNTNAESAAAPASASTSAESVLASGVTGQLTGKLQSLTGISQLTVDPIAQNTQGDQGAVVGIQERVSGSILFTYSTNVTDTQSQTASLKYDLTKQLSVTILRDQNGGYGIAVRLHKVF